MHLRSTFLFALGVCAIGTATGGTVDSVAGFSLAATHRARVDRRVVDAVQAGDATSESEHGYAGYEASSGIVNGRSFRQARGWMRYALTTFDDTEVSLEFTFGADGTTAGNVARGYDVIVEDSMIATRSFSASASPAIVELRVPFAVTKGRANIAVTIRGHDGPTPLLHQLRVLQDHNEVMHQTSFPAAR